jgi:hypothetical protein
MPSTSHTKKDYWVLVNLEQAKADIQDSVAVIEYYNHSRWFVYPQNVATDITITAGAAPDTFGAWGLVVPADIIPFSYHTVGLVIEQVDAATVYHIQLGYNEVNAPPGVNMEAGERRVRIATVPLSRATEVLLIQGHDVPANSTLWARVKTAAGGSENVNISVVLSRHVHIDRQIEKWPSFPW